MLAGKAVSLDSTSNITLGVCCLFDMVTRLEQLSEEEVRSVILYCMLGMFFFFAAEIRRRIVEVYGEEVASRRSVTKWCSDFISLQAGTKGNERIGRLTAAVTPENKTRVAAAVLVNRRVTVSEPEHDLDLSRGIIVRLFRS